MKVRADGHGLQAQIKALYDYRELIEQIFNERELFVPAGETDTIARLEHLSRTRMVRLYAHSDGRSARLSTDMLAFCRLASRRQRLERIGIDVNEAFDAADTELAKWKVAARQGDDELAAELQDRIEEIIDDVEHAFDEQIVNIRERISVQYGFDDRASRQIEDFRYYLGRIHKLHQGANAFTEQLSTDDYDEIAFLMRLSNKMADRFREHGLALTQLVDELQQFISKMRQRQQLTRRSVLFLRWLKRQPLPLSLPLPEACAGDLPALARAPAMLISGFPDLDNPLICELCAPIAREAIKKHRASSKVRQKLVRDPSGVASDSEEKTRAAKATYVAQKSKRWDATPWVNEYLRRVVVAGRENRAAAGLSAVDYWYDRVSEQKHLDSDTPSPSGRAWLNEIATLVFTDRPIGRRRFFERFAVTFRSDAAAGMTAADETPRITDVLIRARSDALRQQPRKRKAVNEAQ